MELELTRVDYTVVGVTNLKCMKLLPRSNANLVQKIAVGDEDGVLHVFFLRKGEVQTIMKTNPGVNISRVELGGALEMPRDKVFASSGSNVKGYTKKGKQFFGFDTNLTEPIKSMHVEGNDLLVCGQHSFYHYQDCKEANYYLCGDVINDVIALNSLKTNKLTPVLACEDKIMRVLDHSTVVKAIPIESSPTVLHLYDNDGGPEGDQILYGTKSGGLGLVKISRNEIKNKWLIEPDESKDMINCLDCYDLNGNGVNELIIGRADGLIEVYSLNADGEQPKLIFSYMSNETITAVQGGMVGTIGYHEVVAVTFSGWVFGLTTAVTDKNVSLTADSGGLSVTQEARQKVQRLRDEIADLEERLEKEREKYQSVIQDGENSVSAIPLIAINEKFYLNKEDATYNLCLEVQTSIDNVLIQSDVSADLLDVEKNSAVVSFSDCSPTDGNFLLATYRCQLNTTRLDLKIRTIEGQHGTLQVYITPNIQPKSCQLRRYRVKPLSLHVRCHDFDSTRPLNRLRLRGGFSFAEIHAWIEHCLPEVSEKPPPEAKATLTFTSSFIGTLLRCTYSPGVGNFESDNLSTISILKDVISKETTKSNKNRNLEIDWDINDESVSHMLSLLHPKLDHQLDLLKKMTILKSVSELDLPHNSADNVSLLTDEYLDIIKREREIIAEYKQHPKYLDRLCGIITDLYVDKHKFQGVNVKNKVAPLLKLLEKDNYSYDKLITFFNQ